MFKRLFTAATLFGLAATAPPVHAQQALCGLRDTVVDRLASRFSEQLVAGGLQNAQSVVEFWASPETGTFTVLISHADGMSCIVSSGTNFHLSLPEAVIDDTPS